MVLRIGLIAAALLLCCHAYVLLLVFEAVLLAVLLRPAVGLIERFTPVSDCWSGGLACLIIGAALAGFLWLMGAQIRAQAAVLAEEVLNLIAAHQGARTR